MTDDDNLQIDDIIGSTHILDLIADILEFKISSDEHYFMQCEAIWILTNLATVQDDEYIQMILASKLNFEEDDEVPDISIDMLHKKSKLLASIDSIMKEFLDEGSKDFKTINLIMLFFQNIALTGN